MPPTCAYAEKALEKLIYYLALGEKKSVGFSRIFEIPKELVVPVVSLLLPLSR